MAPVVTSVPRSCRRRFALKWAFKCRLPHCPCLSLPVAVARIRLVMLLLVLFFDAMEGNRLHASVSCSFVDYPCLAGAPVYWDGVHKSYYHFIEIVSLHQINPLRGTQQQFFVLTIKPLATKQIQVIAPGEKYFADYTLLVQEDTSIETK